jgi:serine protease Do
VHDLSKDMADRLGLNNTNGVVVTDVKPGSFADDTGLNRGDVILEVNKQKVNNEEDFNRIVSGLKSGQDVVFLVHPRGVGPQGGTIFMGGTLP